MESQGIPNSHTTLPKYKAESFTLPDIKTYYQAIVNKILVYWHQDKHTHQWNRIKRTEMEEGPKPNMVGKIALHMYKRAKLDPYLTACTISNSKWVKDLNVRRTTMNSKKLKARAS